MSYLSNDLVNNVVRYAHIPLSQVTVQETDILAMADDSIRSKLVPLILKHCEEFYVYPCNYTFNANQSIYPIPYRAINMKLRNVELVSSSDPDVRFNLDRLNREDLYTSMSGNVWMKVKKTGFYLEGNNVVLYPMPLQSSTDTIRLNYFIRPNQLVDVSQCAQIQSVNFTNNQITCVSVPSTYSTQNTFDIVKAQPGFDCTAIDQSVTNITGNIITFSSTLPTNISVGDYICLSTTSCVVQVPVELQPLLCQYVVVRVLSAQGDSNALKAALSELETLEKNASLLLAPRVEGNPRRVTNTKSIARLV